ncbi:UNVERIFIED_CONTAM: hypothetical protein HHA_319308 [Hammondia hammondi]|eukprot:XP_008885218.1 hypothetical protein HHA_319308 [Hammondia hammondi]
MAFSSAATEDTPNDGTPDLDRSGSRTGHHQSASTPGEKPSDSSREEGRASSSSRRDSSGIKRSNPSLSHSRRPSTASRQSSASSFLSSSTVLRKKRDADEAEGGSSAHVYVLSDRKPEDENSTNSRSSSFIVCPVSPASREDWATTQTGVPRQRKQTRRGSVNRKKSTGGREGERLASGQSSRGRRVSLGGDLFDGAGGGKSGSRRSSPTTPQNKLLLSREEDGGGRNSTQISPSADGSPTTGSRRTSLQLQQQKQQLLQLQQQHEEREREKNLLVQKLKAMKEEGGENGGAKRGNGLAEGSENANMENELTREQRDTAEDTKTRDEGKRRSSETAETGKDGETRNTDPATQPPEVADCKKFEWELTPQAIPYHQQGNPLFDSPAELDARRQLREHPAIQHVLAEVWQVFQKDKNDCISRQEYTNVLMRICLVLLPTLSAESALTIIDNDWRRDSHGSPSLTFNLFRDAFFELADLWTPVVDGEAYATFLSKLFKRITVQQITRRDSAEKIRVVPRIVVRFRTKKAPSSIQESPPSSIQESPPSSIQESPPSSNRATVSLVRRPTDEPRMTAEWTHEEAKELQEAIEQGVSEADALAFEEDVVHSPLPLPLHDTLAVHTVWAEKDEIAPLGAAAQAMVDSVLRQSVLRSREEDEQKGQAEQEREHGERKQEGEARRKQPRAAVYHRAVSGPPTGEGGWPFARRMRDGADYKHVLQNKWGRVEENQKTGECTEGVAVAEGEGSEEPDRENEKELEDTGGDDTDRGDRERDAREDGDREDKGGEEREEGDLGRQGEGQSKWGAGTVERVASATPEAFGWPLRNSSYFQSPEEMRRPLNVAHEKSKLRREKGNVQRPAHALALTVSLGAVPKVVVVDGEAALSNQASSVDAFVITTPDDGLLEALEVKEGERTGGAGEDAGGQRTRTPRILFPSQSDPLLLGEERESKGFNCLAQGSLYLEAAGSVARRTAESLKTLVSLVTCSATPRSAITLSSRCGTARGCERGTGEDPSPSSLFTPPPGDHSGQPYVHEALPASDAGPGLLERDMVNLAITPKQTIVVAGPGIPEKSNLAYKLARNLGLEWLQPEYLLQNLGQLSRHLLSPLAKRLLRQLQAGKAVSTSDSLRLASEFMASRRARAAGYVLELPSDSPRAIERFLKAMKEVSGKLAINWGEFLARQALEGIREAEEGDWEEEEKKKEDERQSEEQNMEGTGAGREDEEVKNRGSTRGESCGEGAMQEEERTGFFQEESWREIGDEREEKGWLEDASGLATKEKGGEGGTNGRDYNSVSWTGEDHEKAEAAENTEGGPVSRHPEEATSQDDKQGDKGALPKSKGQGDTKDGRKTGASQDGLKQGDAPVTEAGDGVSASKTTGKEGGYQLPREEKNPTEDEADADAPSFAGTNKHQGEDGLRSRDQDELSEEEGEEDVRDGASAAIAEGHGEEADAEKDEETAPDVGEEELGGLKPQHEGRLPSASPIEDEGEEEEADQKWTLPASEEGLADRKARDGREGDEHLEGGENAGEEERAEETREEETREEGEREEGEREEEEREEEEREEGEREEGEGRRGEDESDEGEDGGESEEVDEKQEAQEALEKALRAGEKMPNPLMDVYPREVVLVQVESEDADAIAKSFRIDADTGGTVRVLNSTVRTFKRTPLTPGKSTDSLSTVNKSFVDEPPMNWEDLDIGEDLLTALRRMFPPAFACPATPPLRRALSGPGGISENGKMYFPALTADYLREQRELANDILSDIMKAGLRALKLYHGDASTSGMARILAMHINKTPAAVAAAPPFLQTAAPLPTPIRGVEPFTPLADLLSLGLEEARDRERREAEDEVVEEREEGEASDEEDVTPTGLEEGRDQRGSLAHLESRTNSDVSVADDVDASLTHRSGASTGRESVEESDSPQLFSRIWSAWKQSCPVTLFEEGVAAEGRRELAVDYAGRVFLFADEEKQRRFLDDPKTFLGGVPTLDAKKIAVAFSGANRRDAVKQAALLADAFGLSVVDVHLELQREQQRAAAWDRRRREFEKRREERFRERQQRRDAGDRDLSVVGVSKEGDEGREGKGEHEENTLGGRDPKLENANLRTHREEPDEPADEELEEPIPPSPRAFQLTESERAALREGKPLGEDGEETIARVVAHSLGLEQNVQMLEERRAEEDRLRVLVEEFEKKQAESEEELVFPSDIPVDPETHEITLPPLSLLRPACGFVIVHLGRTKREEEALARYGVNIKHWVHFTADVAEEEKETHQMLQELQAEADAAAEAIKQLRRLRPAACPNSSLPQPRISQDFYDPLGQQASLFLDGSLGTRGLSPEKGDLASPPASSSSPAPAVGSSAPSPRAKTGGEGGEDAMRGLANQRDEGQTDVSLQRIPAEGLPNAEQEGRGRNWGTGVAHEETAALAVKELALLTQEEERLFLEYEEGQPDSDLDVSMIRIYTHLSDMAKHYRIRQAIDPFFVAPDDPETIPPLPDLASILAQIDDCTSLHLAPNDRREAPYSASFPFLPPLPPVFYGETGHYCPVSLRRQQWLLPGKPECAVSVQQRIYMCYDRRAKALLSLNPHEFIPSSYLAQQEESEDTSQNTRVDLTGRSAIEDEEEDFCAKVKKEVHVPPPRIAFLGSTGSEVSTHMELFNRSASLPVLHFPSHFSRAFKRLLLRYRRQAEVAKKREDWQEKVAEVARQGRSEGGDSQAAGELVDAEETHAEPQGAALRLPEPEDEMTEDETSPQNSLVFFDAALQNSEGGASGKTTATDRLYGRYDWQQHVWRGWETFDVPENKLQQIRVEAVRQVLHSAMGPALIDGSSFLPLPPVQPPPEDEDEERELAISAPSFASLVDESQRLPDAVVVLTASTQTAAQRTLDLEKIEREAIETAKRKLAARQERQRKREEREQRRAGAEERGEDFDEEEQDEDEEEDDEEEEDEGTVDPLARAAETAAKEALRDFFRRKAIEDEIVLRSAKLFASARVPVLVVNSERTEKTVQRAIGTFLLRFLKHRQSLLLAPQCMRLDKATCAQFLKSGVAKHSRFGVFSPTDVDAMIYPTSLDSPVLLNGRIYYPGPTKAQTEQFCTFPSFFLSSPLPAPRQCVPRCCFLGPPLSGKSRIARLIAEWSGAVYVTPQKALRQCLEEAKSSQLVEQVVHDLRRGRAVSSCCLIRVVHQRLRHSDVLQRGFVLDGCPAHVGHAKRFQVLESLHRIEIPALGRLQDDVHLHAPSPSSTPRAPSFRPSSSAETDAVAEAAGKASDGKRGGGRQACPASRRGGADRGGEGEGDFGEEFDSASTAEKREGRAPEVFRQLARETFRKAMENKQKRQGESSRKNTERGGCTERGRAEKWRRSRSSGEEGTHAKETETKPEKLTRPHTALLEDVALSKTNGQNNTPSSRAVSDSKRGQREETAKEMRETEEELEEGGGEEERERKDKSERRKDDGGRREGDDEGDANEAEHESREDGENSGDQGWEDDEHEEEGEAANRDGVSVDVRKKDKDVETRIHPWEEQRHEDREKHEEEKRAGALRLAALEARKQQRESMDAQSLQEDETLEDDEDDESAIDIVFIFQADEDLTLRRAANIHRTIRNEFPVNDERDFQANAASQKERWSTYRSTIAPLQAHYSSTYSNVILIPSEASVWRQFEIARKEIEGFCRRKHEYLRRKAAGMAARCFFTGRKQSKIQQLVTEALKTYCPVCWTLEGALNDARGIPFYQAEFQGGVYFCCREGHLEAFLKTPSAYIREGVPKDLPTRLSLAELQSFASPPQFQFKGFCSVVFAEDKRFVEGHHALVAKYVGELWKFSSEEALSAFLLYPSNYVELARNVPPEKVEAEALKGTNPPRTLQQIARDGEEKSPPQPALTSLAGELKDALTFLEVSTVELLTEALTMTGLKRPVFPGQSFRQSALRFLALYLHAHNVLTPPVSHRDALQSLGHFVTDCRLPFDIRDKIFALFRLMQTQEGSKALLPGDTWTIVDELEYLRWTERFDELFKVKDHQSGNATVPLFSV